MRTQLAVLVGSMVLLANATLVRADAATPTIGSAVASSTPPAAADSEGVGAWVASHTEAIRPLQPAWSLDFPIEFGQHTLWDTAYLLTAPSRWGRCEWTQFALFVGAVGGTLGLDQPIDEWSRVQNPRSATEADVENAIQKLGEWPGIVTVIGGGYLYGVIGGNERIERAAFSVGEALLISEFVFVEPLKLITGRERPNAGNGPYDWFAGGRSFPSSHTATAFTLASGVAEYADYNPWVAVPAYVLASGVAFSRIRADEHFLSDVFVGATIGVVTTHTVFSLERRRLTRHDAGLQVGLAPFASGDIRGIQLIAQF